MTTINKKPNQVVFDIQKSNVTKLLNPEGFDTFTEAMYQCIDSDQYALMDKFVSSLDHIDIQFKGSEAIQAEEESIDDAIIKSFWEINRKGLNDIMLANNFSKDIMDRHILSSLSVLDMSPKDRKTRLYRVNLHP